MKVYDDRAHAGRELANRLGDYKGRADVVVLGLPRGGVPVAKEVAEQLGAPLDVFLVRKIGVPGREELAMGAIASGGVTVRNEDVIASLRISDDQIEELAQEERAEAQRREETYRGSRPPQDIEGKTVLLVDDGLATGASMRAAVRAVRQRNPAKVVVAVPTGAPQAVVDLEKEADAVVCVDAPSSFGGVGQWYRSFPQTSDGEVRAYLETVQT